MTAVIVASLLAYIPFGIYIATHRDDCDPLAKNVGLLLLFFCVACCIIVTLV
jgi:hypothetical protein